MGILVRISLAGRLSGVDGSLDRSTHTFALLVSPQNRTDNA
jgi:hypothetical protein